MAVDSTIVCIIARELLEAIMFITSYTGAVETCPTLSSEEKSSYIRYLWFGLACGILGGLSISLAVGFSIAEAVDSIDTVANGVEAGEAASKLIAAFFVTSLSIKLPQWFGISAYHKAKKNIPGLTPSESIEYDAESTSVTKKKLPSNEEEYEKNEHSIDSKWSMSINLFWNSLRECTEGGILTAAAAILTSDSNDTLGASIGVGIAAAIGIAIIMAFGAKYISAKGFGIAATVIATCLAVGLITGSTRSFEEVYAVNNDEQHTSVVYDAKDTQTGDILTSFEFIGISDHLTSLVLAVWISSAVILSTVQYWHNYLGYALHPEVSDLKMMCCSYFLIRESKVDQQQVLEGDTDPETV